MSKEEKLQEINHLSEWCIEITKFFLEKSRQEGNFRFERILREQLNICETSRSQWKLSGWREAARDMCEAAESMSPENIEKLNAILREKFGMDLTTMKMRDRRKLDRLVKRGYLKTDNEFRMVEYWVNELCQAEAPDSEIDPLNALLSDYEKRVEAKLATKKARKEARKAGKSATTSPDVSGNG